jgi:membrane protein DedA with SNARE-associated domain/rhodanese-related sulfurtransferase
MVELITQYGLLLIFANVLLERAGLPLPAMPTLLVAGSLVVGGKLSVASVFAVALLACIIGDTIWYAAGWYYGRRIISLLCRISLSPDSCVRQTEGRFERWGKLTLVVAKFVPGLSTVARPLAGTMHLGLRSFTLLNGIGSALWAGAAIAAGMLFHVQIIDVVDRIRDIGVPAMQAVVLLLAAYILFKWWERYRYYNMLSVARITVDELRGLMKGSEAPLVVDLRSSIAREQDPRCIPGALPMSLEEVPRRLDQFPTDREIVFYCACPNEASAAYATKKLIALGYTRVRPLRGGLEAWVTATVTEMRVDAAA